MLQKISAVLFAATVMMLAAAGAAPPQESGRAYDAVRTEAEKFYSEKSFARANALYGEAAKIKLTEEEARWVKFRIADTAWRADAASPDPDPTKREAARASLDELVKVSDWISAEANESLGDYNATHPSIQNPYQAQRYYTAALDWWAGSDDIARARKRYLSIVWRMADHPWRNPLPREILVNVIKIADTPQDRARAQFYLATQYVNERNEVSLERAAELLGEIVKQGKKTEWYDDALYLWASSFDADYGRALELYRRLTAEFAEGESEFVDDARRAIAEITKLTVTVGAAQTFLPASEQEIFLAWRNAKQIELTIRAIDLSRDARWNDDRRNWVDSIQFAGKPVVRQWKFDTKDDGTHRPGQEQLPLTPKLPVGAYLVSARSGSETSHAVVLVTDAHILVHSGGGRSHIYVSDVETGEPIAGASVRVTKGGDKPYETSGKTNAEGFVDLATGVGGQMLITASAGARQAYHTTWSQWWRSQDDASRTWRIYAFTDRPAYRPNETVQWKALARLRVNGRWTTPANEVLSWEIYSPRNEKIANGNSRLNAFGSIWGELPLTPSMPLGAYTIRFQYGEGHAGAAQLFRLEEYKLPEFTVSVSTPADLQYRLGDTIEATIDAQYYFGGPVANAEVEAVVYQEPFVRYWYPWRHYEWYWPDWRPQRSQSVMTRQTLRTDVNGRAVIRIETPRDGSDMSYRIEARVVDASRREVRGEGTVRVTRQRYSVMAYPEHYLHRPNEHVDVKFKAIDANDQPVRTTGTVVVTKRRWRERQYVTEDVLTTKLDTDAQGEAMLTFTPKTAGYYSIRWTSLDGEGGKARDRVTAETTVWVADRDTKDIGYYQRSGIHLIVDNESMRAGETANALIVAPQSGRWVMLSSSTDRIVDTRIVRMDGTAKLVQIQLDERHEPNFFLTASSVFHRQLDTETTRVVVPPVEHFLTVDVKADRAQYQPREEGTLTITTRDANGKPAPAEVAVSVSDEAVTAIQSDPAGDPRQFFYDQLYDQQIQVSAGLQSQQYRMIEPVKEPVVVSDEEDGDVVYGVESGVEGGVPGGVVGGMIGGAMLESRVVAAAPASVAPPPPAPPAPQMMDAVAKRKEAANEAAPAIDVQVRSDFRSTAFWKPDVITDANGTAKITVKFPEALTTWRATARAATSGASFGMGSSTVQTNLPLLVRLQAPRFFVVGDRVTVSAVVNNNTDAAVTVTPELKIDGAALQIVESAKSELRVDARSEARADWVVSAVSAGDVKLRVTARNAQLGDAMEKPFVVYEHGIDKLIAKSGKMRGDLSVIRLDLPRERRATDLTVQIAPSLATTMLDALPYLIEFPYGCTEQTMSRFLPAVIVARTLEKLGLDPSTRLPKKDLDAVTTAGMTRLYDMQHADGGWGWWKEGNSDDWMTAYVIWGFSLAREAGLRVNASAIDRAAAWLTNQLVEHRNEWNDQAWMLHALSAWRSPLTPTLSPARGGEGRVRGQAERKAYDDVYANRERLTAYSRALLALTAHRYGDSARTAVLVRNLEDGVKLERVADDETDSLATAHWGASQRFWWRWYESPVETTAFALRALVTIDPKHKLVEPAMNWLVKNRRGAQWNNTRDTAISLLALTEYLERSGELSGDVSYELSVNGKVIATKQLTAADVLRAPSRISVDASLLRDTEQEIRIRRTGGKAPLYFSAEARFVSLEEPVKAAGNEMFVRREYFRLKPKPTLLKGVLYDRVALRDGDAIQSGERVEVVVTVDAKYDYSYLLFEDLKPGGFEAVALQSGQAMWATQQKTNAMTYVYQELRDRKVAMFIDHLTQGVWEMRYTLRAETPGTFHALPLLGQAMYIPEVRANGDEVRITVRDR